MIHESLDTLPADFLLIIALKEEFKYLKRALNVNLVPETIADRQCYRFTLPAPDNQVAHGVAAFIGDMGAEEAALITAPLLSATNAGLVANIGISGIISDDLRLGDVVVASEADNYLFRSKISAKSSSEPLTFENIKFAGKSLPTTVFLYELLDNLEIVDHLAWQNWINDAKTDLTSLITQSDADFLIEEHLIDATIKIAVGPVATGPWVGAAAAFKQFLKAERNRNFLAMDMESAGVLQGARRVPNIQTIILRGISDPADERKEKLDRIRGGSLREWSMANAIRLFALLIRKVSVSAYSRHATTITSADSGKNRLSVLEEALQQNITREYLTSPYNIRIDSFQSYSALFSCLCSFSPERTKDNLFESIAYAVVNSQRVAPVKVEGPPGSGKSSFLSILYWYLLSERIANPDAPLPLLINLHRYNDPPIESTRDSAIENQLMSLVQSHLLPLRELLKESANTPLVVIIDGDDEYARFREQILSFLFQVLSVSKHWRIIGSRNTATSITPTDDSGEADLSVVFGSIKTDSSYLEDFLKTFISIASPAPDHGLAKVMSSQLRELKLKNIDLFTMSLLFKQQRGSTSPPRHGLAAIFESFCERYLGQRGIPGSKAVLLDRAATLAFDLQIRRVRNPKLRAGDNPLWDLVHKHSRVADYLVARYVINALVKNPNGSAKAANTLRYLYPYRINILCKDILNRDQNTQLQVVKAAGKILQREGSHSTAMAQAVYLIGRVVDWQARGIAKQTLQRFRESLKKKQGDSPVTKEFLLLTRTLSISLAELGDEAAQQDYIEGLLADPKLDMFNRGFHLEYYGDQTFSPADPPRSDDNLGPAPRTFDQLFKELSDTDNPIFEIALYTLCSLAQHRHAIGKLSSAHRRRLAEEIDRALSNRRTKSESLKSYLTMVRKHLQFDTFHVARLFEDFYKIKRERRSGWVKRGIPNPESVADHSYGAYLIALFLLPESWNDPEYDKQKILKMVLIHDLAEAITKDVLPEDSNDESKRREREVYDEIAVLGTYDGLGKLREVTDLWKEFEARTSLNAKIAKDIDKLENLLQLWAYNEDGYSIDDFENWNRELIDAINTAPGLHVLDRLLEAHKGKTGVHYTK